MRAYTVHAPAGEPTPERFVFIKDGFSWPAFFFPILWVLWHRMWLALLGYIVFVLAVAGIGNLAGDVYATILSVLGSFVLGFEGNAIRRLTLARRGWREVGEAFGRNLEEAEIRFFYDWASLPEARRYDGAAGGSSGGAVAASDEPILGLFPEAEGARL